MGPGPGVCPGHFPRGEESVLKEVHIHRCLVRRCLMYRERAVTVFLRTRPFDLFSLFARRDLRKEEG